MRVNKDKSESRRPALPSKEQVAAQARKLLRSRRSAALATLLATGAGWPYASLVTIAADVDGSPILLLSGLSDHTRNIDRDSRASLLIEDASRRANPQTGPRLTLLGHCVPDATPRLRSRFLARHPGAALYAGFSDFRIFRMQVDRAHWVGGFGQARWLDSVAVLADAEASGVLAEIETSTLERMNAEHAGWVEGYAHRLLGRRGAGWRLIAIDPDGCDLARGMAFVRLPFPRVARDGDELWAILNELTR